jgi:hypothetical protein
MPRFRSHPADHRFFGAMALVAAGVIVAGFANTYGRKVLAGTPPLPPVVHLHAALFCTWLVLLVAQAVLVSRGHLALHMRDASACMRGELGVDGRVRLRDRSLRLGSLAPHRPGRGERMFVETRSAIDHVRAPDQAQSRRQPRIPWMSRHRGRPRWISWRWSSRWMPRSPTCAAHRANVSSLEARVPGVRPDEGVFDDLHRRVEAVRREAGS